MTVFIAPVVEGHTEQRCLERLLQRIWAELLSRPERLQVLEPFRGPRDALVHPSGVALTESVQKASLKLRDKTHKDDEAGSRLLILIDAEADCPATLAPRLLTTAQQAVTDITAGCVLARRMFENWIVAGASTLGGINGLPDVLPGRDQWEQRSGAAWLEARLRSKDPARKYKKTVDAAAFVRGMDLVEARTHSPSFDKLCRELEAV